MVKITRKGDVSYLKFLTLITALAMASLSAPPFPREDWKQTESPEKLTLETALKLAYTNNPLLQAAALQYYEREQQRLEMTKFANPQMEWDFDNFLGSGDFAGFDNTEAGAMLTQEFELGGKRKKREIIARAYRDVSALEYDHQKRQIRQEILNSYIDVLAGQEKTKLLEEVYAVQQDILSESEKRYELGKISKTVISRTRIELALIHTEIDKTKYELSGAKTSLTSLWGNPSAGFESAAGNLDSFVNIPTKDEINKEILSHPELAKMAVEQSKTRAELGLETSRRIPNLEIGFGGKRDFEIDSHSLLLSLRLPIPLWNTNSHNIKASKLNLSRIKRRQIHSQIMLRARVETLCQALAYYEETLKHIEKDILPEAEYAYSASREAYAVGRLSQIELLDSQQTFLKVKENQIENFKMYYQTVAELEQLTGIPIIEFHP